MSFRFPKPAVPLFAARLLLVPVAVAALSMLPAWAQDEEPSAPDAESSAVQIEIKNESSNTWTMAPVSSSTGGHQITGLEKGSGKDLKLYDVDARKNFKSGVKWVLGAGKSLNLKVLNLTDKKDKSKKFTNQRAMRFKLTRAKEEVTFFLYSNGGEMKVFLESADLWDNSHTGMFELNQPGAGGITIKNP